MRRNIFMSKVVDKNELKKPRYELNSVTEYKIGGTTYIVSTFFNLDREETLEDALKRLMIRDAEKALSENSDE